MVPKSTKKMTLKGLGQGTVDCSKCHISFLNQTTALHADKEENTTEML